MPERHVVPVTDEKSVVAVHHPGPSDAWFVCCHGFVSDKEGSYEERCNRAVEEGYSAVRFDFRGCGESDGTFVDATLGSRIADLRAVLAYFDPPSCLLFGSSFGAKTAFHTAVDDDRIEAIAARAPVTYNRTFAEARRLVEEDGALSYAPGYVIDERFFRDLDQHPFADVTESLDVPVAIFHGRADQSVPLSDSLEATEALATDVLLQAFAGEGHLFSDEAEGRLRDGLFDWLART